jgi:DNA segregation ATPase FtsK/SpoIIIE-like protein
MHAAICSLLQRTPSEQLKFAFLDPQKLNFSPYNSLTNYHFTDHEGVLGVANKPQEIVSAMIRLDREHHRRTDLIAATMWGDIEGYNAHADPGDRLPYVAVFCDELTLLKVALAKLKNGVKDLDLALKSLISGSRKVGFRIFLALQYLHGNTISQEIASQAALTLAFWNSNQGSINTLRDCSASALPGKGRFIVDGLPGGRQTLQGLYVDRETVVELVSAGPHRPHNPVDDLVLNIITFALNELDGRLPEGEVARVFADLASRRQIANLLKALERVGLVLPFNRKTVPPEPRRLKETRLDEIVKVLQFHPEICFRQVPGDNRLRFGPGAA